MKLKMNGILTLFFALVVQFSFAQTKTVSGTVTDGDGLPLPGVNILVKGETSGTQSDFDGNYSIDVETGKTLVFKYIGFKTQEIKVGAQSQIDVSLVTDSSELDEVVVVGFGERDEDKILQTVSVVGNKEIDDLPAQNPQDLLQGQASGVSITNASGVLGSRSSVRIRGVNSLIGGAQPLFVIDGVPLDDSSQTFGLGGGGLNPLATINPESIETFTVLKDAAATSIYGSRGSNGVILITTKQGSKGTAPAFQFETFIQASEATELPEILNAQQYGNFFIDVLNAQNGLGLNTLEDLRDAGGGDYTQPGFDWLDAATRTGVSENYNFSVRGGSENSTYYLGVNHSDQEGYLIGNNQRNTNIRLNLTTDITDNFRAGANINTSFIDNDRINEENSTFAPVTAAQLIRPNARPTDDEGNFIPSGQTGQNIVGIVALNTSVVETTRLIGNVFSEIDFLDDQFTFRSSLGLDKRFVENIFRDSEVFTPGGAAQNAIGQVERINFTNTLNWEKSFGAHNFGALLGSQFEKTNTRFLNARTVNFLTDALPNVGSGSEPTTTSSTTSESALIGYFTQFNYDFDGKYLFEASFRRDGSSRFGVNNQFGNFYAFSGGWNISAEDFMSESIFNRLRIRASYGTTGNDRIGDFAFQETFSSDDYNGSPGLILDSPALPDLQWEETATFDIGFKSAILNDLIRFNVNYYNKQTDNLLLPVPLTALTGAGTNLVRTTVTRNAGEIENSGFEFDLSASILRDSEFTWDLNFNLSTVKNEVKSLPGAGTDEQGRQFLEGTAAQRAIVGESANSFYLVPYLGVNPETGDAEWLTRDGEATTTRSPSDRRIVGDANPDFYGGFRSSMQYKNWDLNMLFNYTYGNDILVDGDRFVRNANNIGAFNLSTDVLDYWTPDNRNASVPALTSPTFETYQNPSTNQLYDGSFLRLKNVTLGYNLPNKIVEKLGFLSGVRLYATATNLITIKDSRLDGIDPEFTDSLNPLALGESFFVAPQVSTYILGAKFNF
jgi:TonB-linked SusC/RagA family outer membrane protein